MNKDVPIWVWTITLALAFTFYIWLVVTRSDLKDLEKKLQEVPVYLDDPKHPINQKASSGSGNPAEDWGWVSSGNYRAITYTNRTEIWTTDIIQVDSILFLNGKKYKAK